MKENNINEVMKLFYKCLPHGSNFYDLTYELNFEKKERDSILYFLVEQNILKKWGDKGMHVMTTLGKEVVEKHGDISTYLNSLKKDEEKKQKLEGLKEEKLFYDAKLSKWKAKTFWYFFWISVIGAIFAGYNAIEIITQEPVEKKIERIIEEKLQNSLKTP